MFDLKGIIPPLVTPFDETGAVRYDYFEQNFEKYLRAGVQGCLVVGSSGESVYLERAEKLKLIQCARERVPKSMTLLAGTGVESTQATIELTKEAAGLGIDAVLVRNPFYFKNQMTFDVYFRHFVAVADASPVPVILYNVPMFTGIALDSRLIAEVALHPNIRGIKESSGDVRLVSEIVWSTNPQNFSVVSGGAATLFPNMMAGSRGGIVALACAAPKALVDLYRAFVCSDYKRAGIIQRIIASAANAVTTKYGIAGLKTAMALEGFESGVPRLPLLPLGREYKEDLQHIFRRMNSELSEVS